MASFKGLTIAHINIRSVFRKLEEVVRILSEGDIDILCVGETWLNHSVPDHMLAINGYNIVRHDRTIASGKRTGGGVMIYYKNHLDISTLDDLCICNQNVETLWIKLQLKQTRPQYICTVYRPPDGDLTSGRGN